jgi:hypothetical protein
VARRESWRTHSCVQRSHSCERVFPGPGYVGAVRAGNLTAPVTRSTECFTDLGTIAIAGLTDESVCHTSTALCNASAARGAPWLGEGGTERETLIRWPGSVNGACATVWRPTHCRWRCWLPVAARVYARHHADPTLTVSMDSPRGLDGSEAVRLGEMKKPDGSLCAAARLL